MSGFSFRFKLLISMMLVVAGVSVSTLYVTQPRVQAVYDRLFKEHVEMQITYLPRQQEARLATVKRKCLELASSVRLLAALDAGDPEILYKSALDELGSMLRRRQTNPPDSSGPRKKNPPKSWKTVTLSRAAKARMEARIAASQATVADLFRFMNADGEILSPSEETAAVFRMEGVARPKLDLQLAKIGKSISNLRTQQVGYIVVETEEDAGQERILEIVVTPVIDHEINQVLGGLVVGLAYQDFNGKQKNNDEQRINDISAIKSGLWLNNRLYSRTISTNLHHELSALLSANTAQFEDAPEDLIINQDGIPFRVFYTPLNSESQLARAYKVGLYSWKAALEAQEQLRSQIIVFSGLALIVALLISLFLSHGLSVPIHELVAGTEEIKKGNFSVKVPVRSRDELGRLAASFNEMADDLALKERYHNILNMVTDKDVAQELVHGRVTLEGEIRAVSVLFCDIRGFTALSQGMNPAEVIQMLNEHMTALTKVVTRNKGIVDKFVGDEIMAIFGAPKSYDHDIFNAVKTGLEMIEERNKLNETSAYQIQIGIGIASGEALAGNIGSADRSNYTVVGERVNLASRLCSVAGRGELVVCDRTGEFLGEKIVKDELDPMQLKGFTGDIKAFHVKKLAGPTPVDSTPA